MSRPECHARGLIQFCVENPHLRIERHIGLFTNLLPAGFDKVQPIDRELQWLLATDCFKGLIPWIEEALDLSNHGMPQRSFTLVIDGTAKESWTIWKLLKYTAATQEARLK